MKIRIQNEEKTNRRDKNIREKRKNIGNIFF
jgi:hypothetical protein